MHKEHSEMMMRHKKEHKDMMHSMKKGTHPTEVKKAAPKKKAHAKKKTAHMSRHFGM